MMKKKSTKIFHPCNIYDSAIIGEDVNIGMFTEIGHCVSIGEKTRIGAQCFIPEGVNIGSNVFIGPNVCFTNDKYPPSGKEFWGYTTVKNNVSIGAGCIILSGICVGTDAMIGAGSVVTKNVPSGEVWCGNPAKFIKTINLINKLRERQVEDSLIAKL
jgi:acetyltransferase-like isoleucine patch superfamily enzyme